MVGASFRSVCPVARTLEVLGDKWTMLVVRDLFLGRSHFKEFAAAPEKIATNILANRLARLVEHELVEKFPSLEVPGKEAYRLTKKGRTLKPLLNQLVKWGLDNIEGSEFRLQTKKALP